MTPPTPFFTAKVEIPLALEVVLCAAVSPPPPSCSNPNPNRDHKCQLRAQSSHAHLSSPPPPLPSHLFFLASLKQINTDARCHTQLRHKRSIFTSSAHRLVEASEMMPCGPKLRDKSTVEQPGANRYERYSSCG